MFKQYSFFKGEYKNQKKMFQFHAKKSAYLSKSFLINRLISKISRYAIFEGEKTWLNVIKNVQKLWQNLELVSKDLKV